MKKHERGEDENGLSETTKYLRRKFLAQKQNLKCSIKETSKEDYGGQDVSPSKVQVSYIVKHECIRTFSIKF
jgi:uncharacterized protein YnzC (UPF0291/DUF896 family)